MIEHSESIYKSVVSCGELCVFFPYSLFREKSL